MAVIDRVLVGESLVGDGNEVAHIDLIMGPRGSAAEAAFCNCVTNNKDGFSSLLAVVAPNLLTKPNTVMFNKVTIKGSKQAVQMFGPAQRGVAMAVADSVEDGTIPANEADDIFICVGVFIHWLAEDNAKIQDYNYQATKQSKMYAPLVAKHLKEGRLKEAIALSAAKEYRYSHLAKVVLAGLQEYQFQHESGANLSREDLLDTVRRSIQRATALTSNDLKKGVSGLATIGATAPFVGLLGTVIGVINAFVGIASSGSGGIGAVSAGIAEALVETALGLFVAIPAVWFYNYLSGKLEFFNVEMDNSSSEMVDYFIKKTA